MTRRREILQALGALALVQPFASVAQRPERVRRIGWLTIDSPMGWRELFYRTHVFESLLHFGHKEGANLVIERRYAEDKSERLPALAEELVRLKVELIVTWGDDATLAAKRATRTIPIVMAGSTRTVEKGFVESYARPGENITGLDWWPASTLAEQHFQILKSAVPSAMRAARLADPITYTRSDEHARSAASKMGLTLLSVELTGVDDLLKALDRIAALQPDVLSVFGSDTIRPHYREIAEFSARQKLVSMAGVGYAAVGGLLQHSAHRQAMLDRLASYIDRILRGANPASLPVEQPTKYELVLNGKTAKTMGVKFPSAFLTQVDRVIE